MRNIIYQIYYFTLGGIFLALDIASFFNHRLVMKAEVESQLDELGRLKPYLTHMRLNLLVLGVTMIWYGSSQMASKDTIAWVVIVAVVISCSACRYINLGKH